MSELGEYDRERRLYLQKLAAKIAALVELGATRDAEFVASVERYIRQQGTQAWGPTSKQQEVLAKIDRQHGDLLYDKVKRQALVKKREAFMLRFKQLQQAVNAANDERTLTLLTSLETQMNVGRPLSDRQKLVLKSILSRYKIADSYDRRG